jgi:CBS domain containing-hemolysin-like protein
VRDIMTPRTVMFSLSADLSIAEVQDKGSVLNHSRIPVYDKDADDIVGIVLRRDLLTSKLEGSDARIADLMRPIDFVAQTVTVDRLLRMFMERGQQLLMVIDEFGGLAGLVSLEDVLEEILGKEIVDEFDQVADLRELARHRRRRTLN